MSVAEARLGKWLLSSSEEWSARTDVLASTMTELIEQFVRSDSGRGLDVGCQNGALSSLLARRTHLEWWGIDPIIGTERRASNQDVTLLPGVADEIPFDNDHFDCVVLANVFEHLLPELRSRSFDEIARVLRPGGMLIGQLPNPYFPIESHSRLPLMGWLPEPLRRRYWQLAPVPWRNDTFPRDIPFYVVTARHVRRCADNAGLRAELVRNFHYPAAALPTSLRWAAQLFQHTPLRSVPWAWQFAFRKV